MIELPIIDPVAADRPRPKKKQWGSVAEFRGGAAFQQKAPQEFREGALDPPSGTSRRQFLQVMGAAMAMAGLTACRRPEANILPFARKPEEIIPGIPLYYATAMPFRGVVRGLLVESHEGRPTKVEGNRHHPHNLGRTSAFEQASVLDLYDPDRSFSVRRGGEEVDPAQFLAFIREFAAQAPGQRIAIMAEESSSPTRAALRRQLEARYPQLRWVTYTPEGTDPAVMGMQMAFGRPLRPFYRFIESEVIVSLDADFLGPTDRNLMHNAREYAETRRPGSLTDDISRLYVVESTYTNTGAKADHRLRMRSSDIPAFAAALAARLGVAAPEAAGARFVDHPYIEAIAADLQRAGARGVVMAGETQPPAVHALAAAMNGVLGSIGGAMLLLDTGAEPERPPEEDLRELMAAMAAGEVDALFMLDVNPVYNAPGELDFAAAMERVPVTVHLGLHVDETAIVSDWHVPHTHYLEAWGDGRAYDGTLSVIQPLIAPLYEPATSDIEMLALLATGQPTTGYDLVREYWRDNILAGGDFEAAWRRVLHAGFLPDSQYPAVAPAPVAANLDIPVVPEDALEVVFRLDPTLLDGRFANNAWMQELPDPVTKIVWDNVAVMSPETAARLGLEVKYEEGRSWADIVELTIAGRSGTIPVWILPGHADNSITLTFGYGRTLRSYREPADVPFWDTTAKTDVYGDGALATGIGTNVYPFRTAAMERVVIGAEVEKVGEDFLVGTTQEADLMYDRPIVRWATMEEFRENPDFPNEAVEPLRDLEPWGEYPALWQDRHASDQIWYKDDPYFKNQWGMVIDPNACIGCGACVIACQAENNIPSVGKEAASYGREMHWLRVDRYFVSDEDETGDPAMVFQPMFCQHCENAPCEPVCPVSATSHSSDGINEMTYNRCIGTRYCSNNCPYKVRRFNFFNWTKTIPTTVQMQMNPDVTIRFRGVMEKCTYCVQRIRSVQRRASIEDREVQEGEVVTACQEACPADALVFGDINDPNSKVSEMKRNPLNYELLEVLDTQPRNSYWGLLRNPNPLLVREA